MRLTFHAQYRMRQRGVPERILETLYSFGTEYPAGNATKLVFDDVAIDLAAENDGRGRLRHYRGVYLVINDTDVVVTVARVRGRMPRTRPAYKNSALTHEEAAHG